MEDSSYWNPHESTPPLDEILDLVVLRIVSSVGFDPAEIAERLQPPQLRLVRGSNDSINALTGVSADGTPKIYVGGGLYRFLHLYTSAAATYFLNSDKSSKTPSELWPRGKWAVANTLNWLAVSTSSVPFPTIKCTPRQLQIAQTMGDFAFRYVICHELAHVALDHLESTDRDERMVEGERTAVLREMQESEVDADVFGFEI